MYAEKSIRARLKIFPDAINNLFGMDRCCQDQGSFALLRRGIRTARVKPLANLMLVVVHEQGTPSSFGNCYRLHSLYEVRFPEANPCPLVAIKVPSELKVNVLNVYVGRQKRLTRFACLACFLFQVGRYGLLKISLKLLPWKGKLRVQNLAAQRNIDLDDQIWCRMHCQQFCLK